MFTLLWPCKYHSQLSLEQLYDFLFFLISFCLSWSLWWHQFSFAWFSVYLSLIPCPVLRLMCKFPLTLFKHGYFPSSPGDIYPRPYSHSSILTVDFPDLQQLIYICLVYNSLDWKLLSPRILKVLLHIF